ncbi:MAG: SpoIVB peptidase [Clostridia bacterium]|nr:SpoIVB peptidase [Clostridia bacterium]
MSLKRKLLIFIFSLTVLFSLSVLAPTFVFAKTERLYLGGIPSGFVIKTDGALVIGLNEFVTKDGVCSPAKDADIKIGDIITEIGKEKISDIQSISNVLKKSNGNPLEICVVRDGEIIKKFLTPKQDLDGNYKLGVFIRDDLHGIGTITYFTEDGNFGALGHPILNEKGDEIKIKCGTSYLCSIIDVQKGEKGKAGELKGVFVEDTKIGCILKNTKTGIYGKVDKNYKFNNYPLLEISNAIMGDAQIYTCIDGVKSEEYAISIVKIDENNKDNKNFVIKIKDKRLLSVTNGILQGMSGSPIIQNGKIVGAVTHVFINDPSRGFGISIDKMLNN